MHAFRVGSQDSDCSGDLSVRSWRGGPQGVSETVEGDLEGLPGCVAEFRPLEGGVVGSSGQAVVTVYEPPGRQYSGIEEHYTSWLASFNGPGPWTLNMIAQGPANPMSFAVDDHASAGAAEFRTLNFGLVRYLADGPCE